MYELHAAYFLLLVLFAFHVVILLHVAVAVVVARSSCYRCCGLKLLVRCNASVFAVHATSTACWQSGCCSPTQSREKSRCTWKSVPTTQSQVKSSRGAEVDRRNVGARKRFMYRWCHLKLMGYLPIYSYSPIRLCLKQRCACQLRTQNFDKTIIKKQKKQRSTVSSPPYITIMQSVCICLPPSVGHKPTATTCHKFSKP